MHVHVLTTTRPSSCLVRVLTQPCAALPHGPPSAACDVESDPRVVSTPAIYYSLTRDTRGGAGDARTRAPDSTSHTQHTHLWWGGLLWQLQLEHTVPGHPPVGRPSAVAQRKDKYEACERVQRRCSEGFGGHRSTPLQSHHPDPYAPHIDGLHTPHTASPAATHHHARTFSPGGAQAKGGAPLGEP